MKWCEDNRLAPANADVWNIATTKYKEKYGKK